MKVFVVEDQLVMQEALCKACSEHGYDVVGQASDGRSAIANILQARPDIVLLDLELPLTDGFSVIEGIRSQQCHPKFLVMSGFCDHYTVLRIERAAVAGFIDKNTNGMEAVMKALDRIAAGGTYFSEVFRGVRRARGADPLDYTKLLSSREIQLLELLSESLTDAEIGQKMQIAVRTVESHRFNVMHKLGLRNRLDLVRYAQERGIMRSVARSSPGSGLR